MCLCPYVKSDVIRMRIPASLNAPPVKAKPFPLEPLGRNFCIAKS